MVSDKKLAANRANARKSTGPRTAEGKARSRRNAMKHGYAGAGVVVPEAEAREADGRVADWVDAMRPRDGAERAAVEAMARASVRIDRVALASLAALAACTPGDAGGVAVALLGHRYEQACIREFHRTLAELDALKARRASEMPDEPTAGAGRAPIEATGAPATRGIGPGRSLIDVLRARRTAKPPDEATADAGRAPIEAAAGAPRAPIEPKPGRADRDPGPTTGAPIEAKSAEGDGRETKPNPVHLQGEIRVATDLRPDPGRRAGRMSPKRLASALAAARSAAARNKPDAGRGGRAEARPVGGLARTG